MLKMKKAFLGLLFLLIICVSLYAADYAIGDEGPAGGIIFYDKGEYSDGWRYLEAAPADVWIVDGVPAIDLTFDEYYSDDYYQVFGYYRKDASSNNMFVNGKETLGNYSKAEELTSSCQTARREWFTPASPAANLFHQSIFSEAHSAVTSGPSNLLCNRFICIMTADRTVRCFFWGKVFCGEFVKSLSCSEFFVTFMVNQR